MSRSIRKLSRSKRISKKGKTVKGKQVKGKQVKGMTKIRDYNKYKRDFKMLSKIIDSKINKSRRDKYKKTKMRSKHMSTGKGGLKILKKLKSFLKEPVWAADPPSMRELGRFTIRGDDDVNLLNEVENKIRDIREYMDNQHYCQHCNDEGCVMCRQHN